MSKKHTAAEIKEKIEKHGKFLRGGAGGERARPRTTVKLDPVLDGSLANTKSHVEMPRKGLDRDSLTPAKAAKMRREACLYCRCRLCVLALLPPQTFADWAACIGEIETEHLYRTKAARSV